jgi:hypothetical protein
MPELSRFFGIVIRMYINDHYPAHFHASYGEFEALIEIETLAVYRGELPRRALALVLVWCSNGPRSIATNCDRTGNKPAKDKLCNRSPHWK